MWGFQQYYDVIKSILEEKNCTFDGNMEHLIASTNLNWKAILELIKNKEKRPYFSNVCPVCVYLSNLKELTSKLDFISFYLCMYFEWDC